MEQRASSILVAGANNVSAWKIAHDGANRPARRDSMTEIRRSSRVSFCLTRRNIASGRALAVNAPCDVRVQNVFIFTPLQN
jgi:hypothetical protein